MQQQQQQQQQAGSNQLENIKVAVRLRPFTQKERQRNNKRIVDIEQNTVVLYNLNYNDVQLKKFTFDYSYWSHDGFKRDESGLNVPDPEHPNWARYVGQDKVFEDLGSFLLKNALEGYNSALLAYGQTGSGKSYTVSGYGQNEGILPRFARALFIELARKIGSPAGTKQRRQSRNKEEEEEEGDEANAAGGRYEVYFSMIEIYNEVVRDLLAKNDGDPAAQTSMVRRGLKVREHPKHGFFVENLTSYACANKDEIERRIEEGQLNKSIAATSMNEMSSRGHTIYEFKIKQYSSNSAKGADTTTTTTEQPKKAAAAAATGHAKGGETLTTSVVQLVDLAGSERMAVHVTGQMGGDSFIGSRSNTPYPRGGGGLNEKPAAGGGAHTAASRPGGRNKMSSPASASSSSVASSSTLAATSTNSNNHNRRGHQLSAQQQAGAAGASQSSSLTPIHNSNSNSNTNISGSSSSGQPGSSSTSHQLHQRFKESVAINQSLSALGNCIQVMSQYSQQLELANANNNGQLKRAPPKIPYRDSVLTKLLNRCCLSGNSKVVIIATLSPIDSNYDDTLSTLRFADRAKQIRTHAKINLIERSKLVDSELRAAAAAASKRGSPREAIVETRSDSSQTSNFDDNENAEENFAGSKIGASGARAAAAAAATGPSRPADGASTGATPPRSRTITRRSTRVKPGAAAAAGNSSLSINQEQMKRIVSPASRKQLNHAAAAGLGHGGDAPPPASSGSSGSKRTIAKGKSVSKSLLRKQGTMLETEEGQQQLGDEESGVVSVDELDLNGLDDIEEGLLSSDSDDEEDFLATLELGAAVGSDELSNDERIQLFNKMLSNSSSTAAAASSKEQPQQLLGKSKRPKRSNDRRERAGLQKVSVLSSSLKKSNPYLSNLNPDEQLTGVIGYIIKQGTTIVGKSGDCDIVLHGPELRHQHARLTRDTDNIVYIEPILATADTEQAAAAAAAAAATAAAAEPSKSGAGAETAALMVNGNPVGGKVRLNHCDRLLFGTNAYFVFANNASNNADPQSAGTLANLDMVSYDMARNEVLRKLMSEGKNEAMLKEINDYTHRPGTGKHRPIKSADLRAPNHAGGGGGLGSTDDSTTKLFRSMTIHDHPKELEERSPYGAAGAAAGAGAGLGAASKASQPADGSGDMEPTAAAAAELEQQPDAEAIYRERLMEDTYEYTLPVAEVNAVAKEMGIKVQYGLKILTGEEQLPDNLNQQLLYGDSSNLSDGLSSSSVGDASEADRAQARTSSTPRATNLTNGGGGGGGGEQLASDGNNSVTHLCRLDGLDIPPALYIRVHLEEQGLDFYWSKEKFEARRFKILELYAPWDLAGKSGLVEHLIEQSKYQGDYLIDPFVDDPDSTFVLIGHAQVTLTPLSHLSDLEESFEIINMDDEPVGSIKIQAIPCHADESQSPPPPPPLQKGHDGQQEAPFRPFNETELNQCFLDSPSHLLNNRLIFMLKIVSCDGISERFGNIFCQYQLSSETHTIRTRTMREDAIGIFDGSQERTGSSNSSSSHAQAAAAAAAQQKGASGGESLAFEHTHFICFEKVNQDILDFLEHGFLTIQVVGQYRLLSEGGQQQPHKLPTVISTIISSINKYKSKMEQQQHHSGFNGYPNNNNNNNNNSGPFYGSQTGSSKSNRGQQSSSGGPMNSNSASSVASTSATANLYDAQNDDEDGTNSMNGLSQENIIDMILTKRKLDRAENQLHYLKRTINIAEHYNKKHIPLKTVKKLLNSYGHELDSGSLEEFVDVSSKSRTSASKSSACAIQ